MQLIQIGHDGPKVAPIGMGTWAWGDTVFWSYGSDYGEEDLRAAYDASLEAGITFFDTAEVYAAAAQSNCWVALRPPILTSTS